MVAVVANCKLGHSMHVAADPTTNDSIQKLGFALSWTLHDRPLVHVRNDRRLGLALSAEGTEGL